jgi:NAD(P)-dependent dehydrogenase (short-subunit alcohol dehydrogenase family)
VLEGVAVLVAPGAASPLASACEAAGATVTTLDADVADEAATEAASAACDLLLVDGAALFGSGGATQLRAALDGAWSATRAVAAKHLIAAASGGKIVLVGPRPSAGAHAGALRAGLENLARTTSIEWARHGITSVAILPGDDTTDAEVAELAAYLASPAGDYFSGCALSLG